LIEPLKKPASSTQAPSPGLPAPNPDPRFPTPETDLNWGEDRRLFPKLAARIQAALQITWLRHIEPPSVAVALFPPCVFVNVPLFWKRAEIPAFAGMPMAEVPIVPVLHFRVGWRRDMNSGEFYPSIALKVEERTKLW
jgi:hypothetical protein